MMEVKSPKAKTLADGLLERTYVIYVRWNRIKNREVKPVENINKNLQSFLETSPIEKGSSSFT